MDKEILQSTGEFWMANNYLVYITGANGWNLTWWFVGAYLFGFATATISLWTAPWFIRLLFKVMY